MDAEAINRHTAEEIVAFDQNRASMARDKLCLPTSSAREMVGVIGEEIDYVNSLDAPKRTPANPRVALDIDNGVYTVVTLTGREVLIKNP
jgi:hypothetical protein